MIINFDKLSDELLEAGMKPVRVREMVKQIKRDMMDWPEQYTDLENCRWALERGFIPGRVNIYGKEFNEETYRNYYPDFDYFMAHPMNNHFAIWINDKLTLKYMLNSSGMDKYMPEYYLYVENDGRYTYLMDSPQNVNKGKDYLLNLLKEKKHLALKPNNGSGGNGFYGFECRDDKIIVNGDEISREEFDVLAGSLNGYIVTEYVKQSDEIDSVFSGSVCTLRIIMFKKEQMNKEDEPQFDCLISYARFGAGISHGASNMSQGGLAIRINWETGLFEGGFRGRRQFWGMDGVNGFEVHPDSGVKLDGVPVPNWSIIKEGMLEICRHISSLDYMGMDVFITEEGFKICEINSAPSTGLGQFSQGKACLTTEEAKSFARRKKRESSKTFMECIKASIDG